jgi:biopolymer transport protein ExbD
MIAACSSPTRPPSTKLLAASPLDFSCCDKHPNPFVLIARDPQTGEDRAILSGVEVAITKGDNKALYGRFDDLWKVYPHNAVVLIKASTSAPYGVRFGSVVRVIDAAVLTGFHDLAFTHRVGTPATTGFDALVKQWILGRRSAKPEPFPKSSSTIVLVTSHDSICLDRREVTPESLYRAISARLRNGSIEANNGDAPVFFEASAEASFGSVLTVLDTIHRTGAAIARMPPPRPNDSQQSVPDESSDCIAKPGDDLITDVFTPKSEDLGWLRGLPNLS